MFVRDSIGVGDLRTVLDSEGCEDATQVFQRVAFFALNRAFCGLPGQGERLLRAKLFQGGAEARKPSSIAG